MTAYVGIDPSVTNTGLVVILGDKVTDYSIKSTPTDDHWISRVRRYDQNVQAILQALLDNGHGQQHEMCILCEDYALGRFAGSNIATVEMGARLRQGLYSLIVAEHFREITVQFVKPALVKQFATGKGNAKKLDVALALFKRFGVDFGSDHNLYDAYSLARMAYALGGNTANLTKEQIAVAQKVFKKKESSK